MPSAVVVIGALRVKRKSMPLGASLTVWNVQANMEEGWKLLPNTRKTFPLFRYLA